MGKKSNQHNSSINNNEYYATIDFNHCTSFSAPFTNKNLLLLVFFGLPMLERGSINYKLKKAKKERTEGPCLQIYLYLYSKPACFGASREIRFDFPWHSAAKHSQHTILNTISRIVVLNPLDNPNYHHFEHLSLVYCLHF